MSDIRWSYAINQFRPHQFDKFVRRDDQERAFKVLSALGFRYLELQASSGRWQPLGRPELIERSFGSLDGFMTALRDCNLTGISSVYWNPSMPIEEDGYEYRSARNPEHVEKIVEAARPFAGMLGALGGEVLVGRATDQFAAGGELTDADIAAVATAWNAVGAMTATYGVNTVVDIDTLSAFRTTEQIARLLELTDPETVGLSIDTGDVTIALHDAVELISTFANRLGHVQLKDAVHVDELGEYAQPGADRTLLLNGGSRKITRWSWELGVEGGRVDLPGVISTLTASDYDGWVVVETNFGRAPAEIAMHNSWYIQNHLDPDFKRT